MKKIKLKKLLTVILRDYQLYLFVIPVLVHLFLFNYVPMYGVQIAFKDYNIAYGIEGSKWVGFAHFQRFFNSFQFANILKNTLALGLYSLIAGFPIPIIFALLITQTRNKFFKKTVQTVTYAPYFISIVVIVGMMNLFLSPRTGVVNSVLALMNIAPVNFMSQPSLFKHLYVWSDIWQNVGWGSVIYVAALSSINPELYESAKIDGASKFKQILHVDLPGIVPTIVITLILSVGGIMNTGAQKAYLMQNPLTANSQEIIATYTYKIGLIQNQFSYSAAIGLFNTLINLVFLVSVNQISKKLTDNSLW